MANPQWPHFILGFIVQHEVGPDGWLVPVAGAPVQPTVCTNLAGCICVHCKGWMCNYCSEPYYFFFEYFVVYYGLGLKLWVNVTGFAKTPEHVCWYFTLPFPKKNSGA